MSTQVVYEPKQVERCARCSCTRHEHRSAIFCPHGITRAAKWIDRPSAKPTPTR